MVLQPPPHAATAMLVHTDDLALPSCRASHVQAFAQSAPEPEQPRKPPGQIIRYSKEFLLQFMDVSCSCRDGKGFWLLM